MTARPRGVSLVRTGLRALAVVLALLVADRILGFGAPPNRFPERQDWPDSADAHPRLGRVPRPYAAFKTYYRDNPKGYLAAEDIRAETWALYVAPGNDAELILPPNDPELLRGDIRRADPDTTWHVQLAQSRFVIQRQVPYNITFRARADRPREISLEVMQNHPPWNRMGLYANLQLTTAWKDFREIFQSHRTDSNTKIVFHLAGSNAPVEIAAVTLHGPPPRETIDPLMPRPRYFIRHQRNALGCRDRDYAGPRPEPTLRILALGDGFTSGQGVHEPDTFARRLERDLNEQASTAAKVRKYEVINCGVPGYGTREQLLFYESLGAAYRPDILLVTVGWNDARFYWEERLRESLARGPSPLERVSAVVRKIEASRRLRPTYDYHRSVVDLLALDKTARSQGARLIVAVSRHGPVALGNSLLATVTKGLAGTGVPVLDLGTLTAADSTRASPLTTPGPDGHQSAAAALSRWLRSDIFP